MCVELNTWAAHNMNEAMPERGHTCEFECFVGGMFQCALVLQHILYSSTALFVHHRVCPNINRSLRAVRARNA